MAAFTLVPTNVAINRFPVLTAVNPDTHQHSLKGYVQMFPGHTHIPEQSFAGQQGRLCSTGYPTDGQTLPTDGSLVSFQAPGIISQGRLSDLRVCK